MNLKTIQEVTYTTDYPEKDNSLKAQIYRAARDRRPGIKILMKYDELVCSLLELAEIQKNGYQISLCRDDDITVLVGINWLKEREGSNE